MMARVKQVAGFALGLVLAHWIKIFGTQYLWILFYRY